MSGLSDDKKDIEMEEREKKMNDENKAHDKISAAENQDTTDCRVQETCGKIKADNIKEVKPKKIPTGGILMPGFFTRSKSKEKCKDGDSEGQAEEATELVDKEKDDSLMSQAKIKLPNPFRKSKLIVDEDVEKGNDLKEKKGIQLRLPIVSVFSNKKKKDGDLENQTKAGLASMETLDDGDKTADNKNDGMKNIPLDDDKDVEKQDDEPTCGQKMKAYRCAISAFLVFILLLIIIVAVILPTGTSTDGVFEMKDNKFIETVTGCGKVEGILNDGGIAFRGIPYARPPIDELRFRSAMPLDNMDYCWNGTFLAHNATESCLQILSNGTTIGVEDCLTLDVVTPYVRYDSPLPVIVLIGAESFIGGSPGKMRPSSRYARSRDVLFVRPNFRMGVLGFLALDVLSKDVYPHTSGNYALSDIMAALKWVKLNIQHFGGDPNAVTLFGHQAGATLVTALSTMNGAEKYFARAWATSGGALYPKKTLAESEKENISFLKATNCKDVDCLREMEPESLMEAIEDTWRKPQPDLPIQDEHRHQWMVLDGKILKEDPSEVWSNEQGLPVKLVLGSTAHSAASSKLLMKHKVWGEDLISYHVRNSGLGKLNLSEEALEMYPKTYKGLSQMISDIRKVCPLLEITSQMHNTTFYIVTQTRGEQNISDADSDVDAILGRYEPKTPEQRRYVSAIQQLFYHFVWHGKVQTESPNNKVLVVGQDVLPAQNYSHCDYWKTKNVLNFAQLD
ncbi:PREDICTED: neurotactin [Nicrophorus vespilloides]|uniref:Neurotactin n=1 Tax=Nicrophorus vespilloides TaxID=110193 RepID=A0ABM1MXH1_NICVS|nr:PREDICTED: neurotactin [Nicrophorus vespilloides]XP_017779272.1 PREDICTED: neurotactin [Nicrophorus vespilloides]XP_017779273.1 PREDICTED: neurotactin [Nicrophorus vespilloides]